MTLAASAEALDKGSVLAICALHGNDPANLLEIFHDVQARAGHVPMSALPVIAEALNRTRAEVYGVFSFYHDFREAPAGRVEVKVCRAEACQATGAERLIREICARHGLSLHATSADGRVTLTPVYCLGNCALGPAALINGALHGRMDADKLDTLISEAAQ
jgi:formate dehydrogenase subunit gamma